MAMIAESRELFDDWIAAVTGAIDTAASRMIRVRKIRLDEGADATFTANTASGKDGERLPTVAFRLDNGAPQPPLSPEWTSAFRGSRIELHLQPDHVMTRVLDFPSKAGDFLDGMIRSQVDRLTPWSVNDAIFGWSPPEAAANDRIEVAFAATSKAKVEPLVQLARGLDAASVTICASAAGASGVPSGIKLLDTPLRSVIGPSVNLPRLLRMALLSLSVATAVALLASIYFGGSMQSELEDLQRQISQRRAALRQNANGASGLGLLAKRKQSTPSSVMVLEAMSRVLPDSTYVTELRIEGDKVQVVGMTQEAPSLIRLIEQSPQFTRATFFAPTTHAANESGERFHIEAHITAYFGSGS